MTDFPVTGASQAFVDALNANFAELTPSALTVENLAAIKALTSRPESVLVKTGQAAGTWQWVSGSSTTADDALVVQCTSGAAGRYKRVYAGALRALWFAKGDGVANDTTGIQAFLNALCDGGRGDWGDGKFLIDEGILVLKPSDSAALVGYVSATLKIYDAPEISGTATFIGNNTGSGPFLTVRNPPQTSTSGSYYANGSLGNLYFVDNSGSTLLTRHGLFLRGIYAWQFGVVHGFRLGGSVLSFSRETAMGSIDPYATVNCFFRAVRGEFCNGYAIDGDCLQESGNVFVTIGAGGQPASAIGNIVSSAVSITSGTPNLTVVGASFTSADEGKILLIPGAGTAGVMLAAYIVTRVSATQVTLDRNAVTTRSAVASTVTLGVSNGVLFNSGQGSESRSSSVGGTYGWAYHFGHTTHGNRQIHECISLGGSEKGIWVETLQQFRISGRIEGMVDANEVMNYIPAGQMVWPSTCLKIGGGSGVSDGDIDLIIRVDTGTLAMLGSTPFIDLSNDPNISDLRINIVLQDNAGMGLITSSLLGIPVSQFVKNVNSVAGVTIKVNGYSVLSQSRSTVINVRLANNAASAQIPSTGFGTSTSKLNTGTWSASYSGITTAILDASNHKLIVKATGRYRVNAKLTLPVGGASGYITAGSLVKYAIIDDDGVGGLNIIDEGACLVVDSAGIHVIKMGNSSYYMAEGHTVWISLTAAGQNGTCYLTALTDHTAANRLEMNLINPD